MLHPSRLYLARGDHLALHHPDVPLLDPDFPLLELDSAFQARALRLVRFQRVVVSPFHLIVPRTE